MEFETNQTPFKMNEISCKLFNEQFLSDITFVVEGKHIYAHSLELMKRSTVFQKQLEPTFGEKKIIPINDYGYKVFYQFIRFIYTDEYDISDENRAELLKLAKQYNVIRLMNDLLNSECQANFINFCVAENYEIGLNTTKLLVADNCSEIVKSDSFILLHPDTVKVILKMDQIEDCVQETDIFDALIKWMNYQCAQNNIELTDRRQKFDELIRLIRFPTISTTDLCEINKKCSDVLTKSDLQEIAALKIYEADSKHGIWNCSPRQNFICPYQGMVSSTGSGLVTTFSVTSEVILSGFVFGSPLSESTVKVSCIHPKLGLVTEINLTGVSAPDDSLVILNLGASIRMQPNFTYKIEYRFIEDDRKVQTAINVWSRKPHTEVIINAPSNSIKMIEAHPTMFEMLFLKSK